MLVHSFLPQEDGMPTPAPPTQNLPASVAPPAPATHLTPRSNALVPLWTSGLYAEADTALKVQLVECLMRPMGALGLVAVADGVFAALRHRHGWQRLQVTADDLVSVSADDVYQLAGYLLEAAPEAFGRVVHLLASNPTALATVSGVLLWQALRSAGRRGGLAR